MTLRSSVTLTSKRGSSAAARSAASSLSRTLPDRYSAAGISAAGFRVVEDQGAQLARGPRSAVMPSSRAMPSSRTSPQTSRQIASASAGLSAPSRGLRGATTRSVKMAALTAVWPTGSKFSSASTSGAYGS